MPELIGGFVLGLLAGFVIMSDSSKQSPTYKLGKEVQKVIDVCEEKLPRNEKCTFLIISERDAPESKLIYDEEKE